MINPNIFIKNVRLLRVRPSVGTSSNRISFTKKMDSWISESRKLCEKIEKLSKTVEIHHCKCQTLAKRVKSLVNSIAAKDANSFNLNDLHIKGCLSLLSVTFEEISEYFSVLQVKDKTLERRVKRYGSDEETFGKWNMTFETCFDDLDLPNVDVFDANQEASDFNNDMQFLNENLQLIFSNSAGLTKADEEVAVAGIQKMLVQQQTDRAQFKTLQEVKQEKVFDTKAIRFEKVIGKGGKSEI